MQSARSSQAERRCASIDSRVGSSIHRSTKRSLTVEQLEARQLLAIDLQLVKDINTNLSLVSMGSSTEVGAITYFAGYSTSGAGLWKTDGTQAGTVLVRDFSSSAYDTPTQLMSVNGIVYFNMFSGAGEELWKSDGTAAGTTLLKDIEPGSGSSYPDSLTNVAGTLYFTAQRLSSGAELWKSDGTAAGTVIVRDLYPGATGSYPSSLTAVGSTLFFAAETANGVELFKSNGTSATTVQVRDIVPGAGSSAPDNLVNLNGTLYFSARDNLDQTGLWKSSGTAATTHVG